MDNLEKEIYEGLVKNMEIDESTIPGFTYDSPIFAADEGEVNMGLDSLDSLELVVMIYETWGINVPAEDMGQLRTINQIAGYIRQHR